MFALAVTAILNSCAPNTPASRIAQNPVIFDKLSENDKQLAQIGQIQKGMHRDGVLLAWGKPDTMTSGSKKGKSFEKWIYTSTSPVYVNRLHPFGGLSYGRHGRYGRYSGRNYGYYGGLRFGPDVQYVERPTAYVEFDYRNKVSSWSKRR